MSADAPAWLQLDGEIRDELYRELLQLAGRLEMFAVLVVRSPDELGGRARILRDELSPFLVRQDWTTEWPGTRLIGHRAWVGRYAMTADCVDVLTQAASGMFEWQHPDLLEDLSILRPDGTTWFSNTAHEHQSSFALSDRERAALLAELPALGALLA